MQHTWCLANLMGLLYSCCCIVFRLIAYLPLGDLEGALTFYREVYKAKRKQFGPKHESTLLSQTNLGSLLNDLGKLDMAEEHLREAFILKKTYLGLDNESTLITASNLTRLLLDRGNAAALKEAENIARETLLERRRRKLPSSRISERDLADVLVSLGGNNHLAEAKEILDELDKSIVLRPPILSTLKEQRVRGRLLYAQNFVLHAENKLRESLEGFLRENCIVEARRSARELARVLREQGKNKDATNIEARITSFVFTLL